MRERRRPWRERCRASVKTWMVLNCMRSSCFFDRCDLPQGTSLSSVLWSRESISEGRSAPPPARHRCLVRLVAVRKVEAHTSDEALCLGGRLLQALVTGKLSPFSRRACVSLFLPPRQAFPWQDTGSGRRDVWFLACNLARNLGSIVGELVMVPDEHVVTLTAVRHTLVCYDPMVPHYRRCRVSLSFSLTVVLPDVATSCAKELPQALGSLRGRSVKKIVRYKDY